MPGYAIFEDGKKKPEIWTNDYDTAQMWLTRLAKAGHKVRMVCV